MSDYMVNHYKNAPDYLDKEDIDWEVRNANDDGEELPE